MSNHVFLSRLYEFLYDRTDYMIYSRGSADDFDRYANITGDGGWSWKALQPYIKKVIRLNSRWFRLFIWDNCLPCSTNEWFHQQTVTIPPGRLICLLMVHQGLWGFHCLDGHWVSTTWSWRRPNSYRRSSLSVRTRTPGPRSASVSRSFSWLSILRF